MIVDGRREDVVPHGPCDVVVAFQFALREYGHFLFDCWETGGGDKEAVVLYWAYFCVVVGG
jgi:hypothetical protein